MTAFLAKITIYPGYLEEGDVNMRISGSSLAESAWQLYQNNQKYGAQTTFNDMLRSVTGDVQNATDPKAQIWSDYQAWKSQQPKRVLPDSKGVTEENLTYLLEHFTEDKRTGELSLFQRIEVLDTMREMGILTQEEMMNVLGLGKSNLVIGGKIGDPPKLVCLGLGGDYQMHEWSTVLHQLPLSRMNNLNDLFETVDIMLRGTSAEGTAAEIREVMERVSPGLGTSYSFTESAYPLYQNNQQNKQPSPQTTTYDLADEIQALLDIVTHSVSFTESAYRLYQNNQSSLQAKTYYLADAIQTLLDIRV